MQRKTTKATQAKLKCSEPAERKPLQAQLHKLRNTMQKSWRDAATSCKQRQPQAATQAAPNQKTTISQVQAQANDFSHEKMKDENGVEI